MHRNGQRNAPRSHCWTCRRRRLVCDATRPQCQRCQKDTIPCPGYAVNKPLQFLTPGQTNRFLRKTTATSGNQPKDGQTASGRNFVTLPLAKSVPWMRDQDERRGFNLFYDRLLHNFPPGFLTPWQSCIMPVAFSEPSLRQAISCLGLLSTEGHALPKMTPRSQSALMYCSAVSSARKAIQGPKQLELAIVLSTFFAFIEFRAENWSNGTAHINAAARMFGTWNLADSPSKELATLLTSGLMITSIFPLELVELAEPILGRYGEKRGRTTAHQNYWYQKCVAVLSEKGPEQNLSLKELVEACGMIGAAVRGMYRLAPARPQTGVDLLRSVQFDILSACTRWLKRFETFRSHATAYEVQVGHLARTRVYTCRTITLAMSPCGQEFNWEAALPNFKLLCDATNECLKYFEEVSVAPFGVGVTAGVIIHLSHVAHRCQDPDVRNNAYQLLRRCKEVSRLPQP